MKSETYRAACEQAKSELKDIVGEFEALRMRKEQIERMIAVLEPLSGSNDGTSLHLERSSELRAEAGAEAEIHELVHAGSAEAEAKQEPSDTYVPMFTLVESKPTASEWMQDETPAEAQESTEEEEPFKAEEVSSDPIKRRIANALRHRSVLRDNREYNQAFSGSITRW